MNRKSKLFREIRHMQKPKLLMGFSDHDGFTSCQCCNETANTYTYIPVLDNMYVCDKHRYKWDRWGLVLFKEMIHCE
jgi:hypothetical protein